MYPNSTNNYKNNYYSTDLIMKRNAGVRSDALLPSTESPEVLGRLRNNIGEELHNNPAL